MTRYLSSFLITSILYSIVIEIFFYAYSNQHIIVKEKVEKKVLSLKHVELVKKVEAKVPVIEEKIIKTVSKDIKPIKKIVKKEKPKVLKKKIKKKPKIKKVVEKKIIKKEEPQILKELTKKETIVPVIVTQNEYKEDFLKKNLFLIKKHIQNNVKYSKRARRMNIEGDVLVEFCLSKNGEITSIKALSGHKLLRKSTIKAIYKAAILFPKVSRSITIKVPIAYKLI